MLESLRKGSKNIFVKAFMGVLALSFVIWGVGDVFRGRSSNSIAKIGDMELSYSEFSDSLQREITRYQQILGRSLTDEQIEQFNIKRNVLNHLIDSKLIRLRARDLKVMVGDEAVMDQIMSNSIFFDDHGKFSKENFDLILRSNGINKASYIDSLKEDTAISLLIDSVAAHPASMQGQAKILYEHRNEQRIADLLVVPANYVKEVGEPSDADLIQYYQEHADKFTVPELREVSYITFGMQNVKDDIKVSEDELRAEYESAVDSYTTPEMRDVDQYLFSDEDSTKAALASLKDGKYRDFEEQKVALGKITKSDLPDEVQDVVFGLEDKAISDPVKTMMGWHLFVIKNVEPARTLSFNEVRSDIEKALKESRSSDMFYEFANRVEDQMAAGVSLEDIAKKFDLIVHKVPSVDRMGKGAGGNILSDLPAQDTFLPLVFGLDAQVESPMTLLPDNATYVVAKVNSISPKRVKALDEVKGNARELWKEDAKVKQLKKKATDIAAMIKNGEKIEDVAGKMALKIKPAKKVTRPSPNSFMEGVEGEPVALAEELFRLNDGGVTGAYEAEDGSFMIGQLKEIKEADMKEDDLSKLENSLKDNFADDVLSQYNTYLRRHYPVLVNKGALESAKM